MLRVLFWVVLGASAAAREVAPALQRDTRPAIAVAYFNDGAIPASVPELAVLAKGITGLVTAALKANVGLRVVERDRVTAFVASQRADRQRPVDREAAIRMGRALRVRHVVFGGYGLDSTGGFRLDLRAVDVETATIEYVEVRSGRVEHVLDYIDQLADGFGRRIAAVPAPTPTAPSATAAQKPDVVAQIATPSSPHSLPRAQVNLESLTEYARGLEAADAGDRRQAVSHFGAALTHIPDFEAAAKELRKLQPAKVAR
ncbi:MAG: hypothetical protein NVS4B3_11390 [Gemmatimonadaceae bacterium]